ncbi:MAG: PAS domain S-box protein, partial [Rubrivivax sp.]|nr:PAS domain S-box protein [Rubrivivax sp.]
MKPSRYLGTRLVAIAVVVMLPLLAIVGYGLYEGVRDAESRAREALPEQASLAAAQVSAALDRAARVLEFGAARIAGRPVDDSTCQRELGGLDAVDAMMGNLGVIGFDGRVLCVLVPAPGGRIPTIEVDAEFQRAAASESIWISQPFRSQISGAPALMMTSPLRDADGRRIGLVGARLDLSRLDALLASMQRPAGGALAVVDPAGAVVRRSGPGVTEGAAPRAEEGTAEPSMLLASADVGRFGWRVVASVQRDVLLAPVRERVMLAAASVWVATLLGVLAALRAARHVARPLQDLLATTRAQRGGRTQARADEGAPGEFGQLAVEFNRMVEQLRRTEANLGESERRYADLFGNIQLAAAMVDLEGRFVYVNDHLLAVTGWRRDELLGQDIFATLLPHRLAQREKALAQLQAGHVAGHNETDIVTRSGERRRLKAFRTVLRSPDGDVIGLAMMAEDITERRAAERKATRLSAFYAALSRTGEALVRIQDEPSLYDALCRICVETGQADRADLIGTEDDQAWLAAQFAREPLFDQTLYPTRFSLSERPWLLTSQAIRSGEPLICADYASDPRTAAARERGYGIGYRSLAVLPLR